MKNLYSEISNTLPIHPLRRFFRLVAGERKSIISIYIYAILAGIIGLSLPLGIQAIINLVSTGAITTSWFVLVVIVTGGVLSGGVLQILQLTLSESIQQRIFAKSALELAFRIPRIDAVPLRRKYVPELVNRFFDTVTVQKGLSKILLDFSSAILQIFFGLFLLAFYHPFFIVFGFGLLFILFMIIRLTGPVGLRTSLKESKHKYEVAHWLEEIGRKRELFKGKEPSNKSLHKTDDLTMDYLKARKKHFRILVVKYVILLLFKVVVIAGLLVIGSLLVVEGQLNLGQFVAAEIVIILLINSVEKLVLSVETIYDVLTGLEKLGYLTDMPLEPNLKVHPGDDVTKLGLRFVDYSLKFPGIARPELEGINLEISAGERVWIRGGNVQLRRAIVRSIAAEYHTYDGRLTIGGVPIRNWNKERLREQLAVYRNADDLIDGTIFENVTLLSGDVAMSEVTRVAEEIGLLEYVEMEQEGWNAQTGPDGIWLPENIKARIVLCRLLLAKPQIFMLMEMFSTLDQATCSRFWAILKKEFPEATVLVLDARTGDCATFDQIHEFKGKSLQQVNDNN